MGAGIIVAYDESIVENTLSETHTRQHSARSVPEHRQLLPQIQNLRRLCKTRVFNTTFW